MSEKVKVLLVGEAGPDEGSLRAQLDALGYTLELASAAEEALEAVECDLPDLVIIDATAPNVDAYDLASRVKELTRDQAVPVMFACLANDLQAEVAGRDIGADDCFPKPIDTEALAARIRLLLRNRELERSLRRQHRESELLNRELVLARQALDRELDLASRIQRSLLPETFPELDRFQFAAALRSSGPVSGDFYDIYRLDETHYGFYVADAVGHGVPAALLTIFVKKGLETRDITPDGYRLLSPGEVLARLNRDLIAQKLSGNPFITLLYAILDVDAGMLTFASGGHPPAICLGADGSVRPLLSEGALLGIFESDFTTGRLALAPGDIVTLYTDGIEQARSSSGKPGLDAFLEYLRAWDAPRVPSDVSRAAFARHVHDAFAALLEKDPAIERRDDVTVLALRMLG
jgi:sigma-B regulation protein RsbU (phosphoserine phosphatase)